jgi:Sel1 repeat
MKQLRSLQPRQDSFLARRARCCLLVGLAWVVQIGWAAEPAPQPTLTAGDVAISKGESGKVEKPEPRPLPFSTKPDLDAAEHGNVEAQFILGMCYEEGKGVPRDYAEAVKWFHRAADHGHAAAECQLGFCYFVGEGVKQDAEEAARWYGKAAGQGNAAGQFNLGSCYAAGKGVAKDAAEAVRWYRRSAEQGFAKAQYNLGVCCESGFGISQDPFVAVKWYRKAADQGLATAQRNLGICYANGKGVEQNVVEAYKWLSLAAAQGNESAQKSRAELEGKMTVEQIAQAQRLPDSLGLVPWSEKPPGTNASSVLTLTLETPRSTFRTPEGISFTVGFHNDTTTNLLLNGGAMLANGVQIWSSLEAELRGENGDRIPMTLGMGVPVSGRIYFLGVPLRAGSAYQLFVGGRDYFAGTTGVIKPGRYELRCVYHGRQSPYRDSTQMPACWEGDVQSNTLHIKVLRAHPSGLSGFFSQMWDVFR